MDKIYSISEASEILGVHPNTLRRWDRLKILSSIRVGERGDRKYSQTEIDRLLQKGLNQFKGPQTKDKPHIGVGVLVVNEKKEVLLTKRGEKYGRGEYALPGGRIVFGESPRKSAEREILENFGIKANPEPFSTTFNSDYLEMGEHPVVINFSWNIKKNSLKIPPGWKWYPLRKLPKPLFGPSRDTIETWKNGRKWNF